LKSLITETSSVKVFISESPQRFVANNKLNSLVSKLRTRIKILLPEITFSPPAEVVVTENTCYKVVFPIMKTFAFC
jgi:hypothetical protein